jgi:nucleoside-diphosphate-sugar epimerase
MRLLLTGADGFTGIHLTDAARLAGYEVFSLKGDLQDETAVRQQVLELMPTHVIHLAGISHVTAEDELAYYGVNLLGSLNLLKALVDLSAAPSKVILASTSNVYGNNTHSPIAETATPSPVSHYAMSKLAMEYMSQPFLSRLPIVITRPFNYTGIGHAAHFVIPKIVEHFRCKAKAIELGDITVLREYNDVRDICQMYLKLLALGESGKTYNLATAREYSLKQVIGLLEVISGHVIDVIVNPQFIRANEIARLCGDAHLLEQCIGQQNLHSLKDTLQWMLESKA